MRLHSSAKFSVQPLNGLFDDDIELIDASIQSHHLQAVRLIANQVVRYKRLLNNGLIGPDRVIPASQQRPSGLPFPAIEACHNRFSGQEGQCPEEKSLCRA